MRADVKRTRIEGRIAVGVEGEQPELSLVYGWYTA